ncbi:MAG: DJ-1/PfpI family protein [Porphyromonas sp.]|nr:DJ-1/PfpI family protein [Porphyromonas sp.]
MKRVFVFLAEGFEEIEAISTIDILRRAEIGVTTVSITSEREVVGAHGVPVIADKCIAEVKHTDTDAIILPGGLPGATNLEASEPLREMIAEANKGGLLLAAICAAPVVYGSAGLLKDKVATAYPGFEEKLACKQYSQTESVVVDGNIITGRGPGYSFSFALAIVEYLLDRETANAVAGGMLLTESLR